MIRVGVVGAGSMGALHARVVSSGSATQLEWVSDPVVRVGKALAERYGTRYTSHPDLDCIDALIIAAPTEHHHELGIEAIAAGIPVLLEKPLSQSMSQSEELVRRSAEMGVPLMCGFMERFNPAIRTAIDIVERPLHLRAVRHSPYVDRIRTGVGSDLLIHDADIALHVFGRAPSGVTGQAGFFHPKSDADSEDVVEAALMFDDGGVASLSASRVSQRKIRELVIAEEDRLVEVDLLRQDITIYRHIGDSTAIDDDGLGYRQQTIIDIPVIRHKGEPLSLQLQHFVDILMGHVDADTERATLLPPHLVVHQALVSASANVPMPIEIADRQSNEVTG